MNSQDLVVKISLWSKPLTWQTNWSITQGKNTWCYWIVPPACFQTLNHISGVGPIHVSHIPRRQVSCISQDYWGLCVPLMHEGCCLTGLMQKQSSLVSPADWSAGSDPNSRRAVTHRPQGCDTSIHTLSLHLSEMKSISAFLSWHLHLSLSPCY